MNRVTRAALLAAALAVAIACGPAAGSPEALRAELSRMGRADQADRDGIAAAVARNDTAYLRRLRATDSTRTARLREIVAAHGWPRTDVVGAEAAKAAWLIVQHTSDTAFRSSVLPQLDSAAARGDLSRGDLAMLTDRMLVEAGKPQRYGNSFAVVLGHLVMHPVEDLAHLEERRAAVGLPPMTEYVEQLKKLYNMPVDWPPRAHVEM